MKKLALWTAAAVVLSGCLTPRSVVVGQTAAPVGRGATEVGLATGFAYQSEMAPGYLTKDSTGTKDLFAQKLSRGFSLPAFEANGQIGVSEMVAVNLHASSAGIQPGAKITLNRGFGQVALLPEVAFGYGSSAASTFLTGQDGKQNESDPGATSSLNFLAGLKVIASHRMGLYGALGYDLQLSSAVTTGTTGVGGATQSTVSSVGSVQHNFTGAIGFDWKMGQVHLRPELAAAITPGISIHTVNGPDVSDNGGGMGFLIMPTLTLAVASDPKKDDSGLIEDERNIGDTDGGDEEVPPRPDERDERRDEERDRGEDELRDD